MYSDDVVRVALAGGGRDGFLISYDKELGQAAAAADDKKDDKDRPMSIADGQVTRYSPTAKAAATVIAAILEKAAKDEIKDGHHDVFDKAFKQAAKEV